MTKTREELLATFGQSHLEAVTAALDEYGAASHEREVDRVKLAILRISEGDIEKLKYWVKVAKTDYRDVLAAAETGPLSPKEGAKLQAKARDVVDKWGKK